MKIPVQIAELFDKESAGLTHGSVTLSLYLRDGKPRYVIGKELSIIPADVQSLGLLSDSIEKKKESLSKDPIVGKEGEK
jgi:hypothetical protein